MSTYYNNTIFYIPHYYIVDYWEIVENGIISSGDVINNHCYRNKKNIRKHVCNIIIMIYFYLLHCNNENTLFFVADTVFQDIFNSSYCISLRPFYRNKKLKTFTIRFRPKV